jgi:carboxyl-terminal processing protease
MNRALRAAVALLLAGGSSPDRMSGSGARAEESPAPSCPVETVRAELARRGLAPDADAWTAAAMPALARAADPDGGRWFTPEAWAAFERDLDGDAIGYGWRWAIRDGQTVLEDIWPGGPADAAGLKPGDLLERAHGEILTGRAAEQVAALLDRPAPLAYRVVREGGAQPIGGELEPARCHPPVCAAREDLPGGLRLVRLHAIRPGAAEAVHAAWREGDAAAGLILDLRGAAGTDEAEATRVLSGLLPPGPGWTWTPRDGGASQTVFIPPWSGKRPDPVPRVAVLTNRRTRGAAELLALAVHASGGRCFAVGEPGAGDPLTRAGLVLGPGVMYLRVRDLWMRGEPGTARPPLSVPDRPGDAALGHAADLLRALARLDGGPLPTPGTTP